MALAHRVLFPSAMKNNTSSTITLFRLTSLVLGLTLAHCGPPEESESELDAVNQDSITAEAANPSRTEEAIARSPACGAHLAHAKANQH
jgi:hypothetical protein